MTETEVMDTEDHEGDKLLAAEADKDVKGNEEKGVTPPPTEPEVIQLEDSEKYEESDVIEVPETSPKPKVEPVQNEKKDLISGCQDYCNFAETRALDFLAHFNHPVLPWMRDLNKAHINHFISNSKKIENLIEKSVGLILMIDYISAAIENPLYSDNISLHFDNLHEELLKKLLFELRRIVQKWSFSDNKEVKLRCEKITSYLKRLLSIYQSTRIEPIITGILDILQKKSNTPLTRMLKPLKRPILFDDDDEEEDGVKDKSILTVISDNAKFKSKAETEIPRSTSTLVLAKSPKSKQTTLQFAKSLPSTSKGLATPSPKKLRLDNDDVIHVPVTDKPKVNAFALMMNKSRELSKQKGKDSKLGGKVDKNQKTLDSFLKKKS